MLESLNIYVRRVAQQNLERRPLKRFGVCAEHLAQTVFGIGARDPVNGLHSKLL